MCDGCCDCRQNGANNVHYIAPLVAAVLAHDIEDEGMVKDAS